MHLENQARIVIKSCVIGSYFYQIHHNYLRTAASMRRTEALASVKIKV